MKRVWVSLLVPALVCSLLASALAEDYEDFYSSDGQRIRGKLMGWSEDGQMNFMRQDNGQVYLVPFIFWDEATRERLMDEAIEAFRRSGMIGLRVNAVTYERMKLDYGPQIHMDAKSRFMFAAWSTSSCTSRGFAGGLIRVSNESPAVLEGLRLEVRLRPGTLRTLTRVSDRDALREAEVKLLNQDRLSRTLKVNYVHALEPLAPGETRVLALPPAFPTDFRHLDEDRRYTMASQDLDYSVEARLMHGDSVVTLEEDSTEDEEADEADEVADLEREPWPDQLEPQPLRYTSLGELHSGDDEARERTFEARPWVLARVHKDRVELPEAPHLSQVHRLESASGQVLEVELVNLHGDRLSFTSDERPGTRQVQLAALSEESRAYVRRWYRLQSLADEVRFDFKRRTSDDSRMRYGYNASPSKRREFVGSVDMTGNLREAQATLVMVTVHREYRQTSAGTRSVEIYNSRSRSYGEADMNGQLTIEMVLNGENLEAFEGVWMGVYAEDTLLAHATYPEDFNPWEIDYGEPVRF